MPDRATFEKAYEGGVVPWDRNEPAPHYAAIFDRIESPVLDAGCGYGTVANALAARGHQVVGIDFVDRALEKARASAVGEVRFEKRDALTLTDWAERFNTVIDSGLFHVFENPTRQQYVAGLAHVINPGGTLYLAAGSTDEKQPVIPKVSRDDLQNAFADGWEIESINPVEFQINPDYVFSDGARLDTARGWFAIIRRK